METGYTLATMDGTIKRYFSLDNGWTTNKDEACWFWTAQEASNAAFDEGLDDNETTIEEA